MKTKNGHGIASVRKDAKRLPDAEVLSLVRTAQHAASQSERERAESALVRHFRGFIHRLAHSFSGGRVDREDLFQDASIGLLHAIRKFPLGETDFPAYAMRSIRNALTDSARTQRILWSIPYPAAAARYYEHCSAYAHKYDKEPAQEAAIRALGLGEKAARTLRDYLEASVLVSLDEHCRADEEGSESIGSQLAGDERSSPQASYEEKRFYAECAALSEQARLSQPAMGILSYRLESSSQPYTYAEIAEMMGRKRSAVVKMARHARTKLERFAREHRLGVFAEGAVFVS